MNCRRWLLAGLVALVPSAATACGSSSGATAGADAGPRGADGGGASDGQAFGGDGAFTDAAPIPIGSLCPLFTQDLCIYFTQCQMVPYRDIAHCVAENDCYGLPQLMEAANHGAVVYDPSKVGACDARFRADPCNFGFFLTTPDIFEVLGDCPGAVTPELGVGDACLSSGECKSGLHCDKPTGKCPGTCVAYATTGQTCTGNGFSTPDGGAPFCDDTLICNSRNVCQTEGEIGSACSMNVDCGPTITCTGSPQCASVSHNLWCNTGTGTCTAAVPSGAACGSTAQGIAACADGLWCQPNTATTSINPPGTCAAPGGVGATCTDLGGCQQGLHCAGYQFGTKLGQCAAAGASGSACGSASDCAAGLACIYTTGASSTCSTPRTLGGACSSGDQCQSGLTCTGGMCLNARYPGDACGDAMSACVLSLCKGGTCVDHAKVGQPCTTGTDCTTGACIGGTCADTSVCSNPGDGG
jgi:hypothetical protein